ncbi:MAG: hypothetical protein K2K58_00170 [Muribaculaceae bacterium]|nr:hypothetical protein [Muribaculaceae bacterium]
MKNISVLITLSDKTVSLATIDGDGNGILKPFPSWTSPKSIKDFIGDSQPVFGDVFCMEVIKYIEKLPLEDDSEIYDIPIVILLENKLSDKVAANIKSEFLRRGFNKVKTIRIDFVASEFFRREGKWQSVVTVHSDGTDLAVALTLSGQPGAIERITLPGMGSDPRIDALAEKIWDEVSENTIDLSIENEMPALRRAAEAYLESGKSELQGSIHLSDGDDYDFFVDRSMVPKSQTKKLEADFSGFLADYDLIDRSRSLLLLSGEATESNFLKNILSPGFGDVQQIKDNLEEALIKFGAAEASADTSFEKKIVPASAGVKPPERPADKPADKPQNPPGDDVPPPPVAEEELLPVNIEAKIEKIKTGFMKRKSVLKIDISSPGNPKIKWHSVLCVQEKPLSSILPENIVREYDRGAKLPFSLTLDLPLKHCPNAKRLRMYFKPHPDEPVGINNAYETEPCTVTL